MLKVNYINVTIWVLAIILIVILGFVIGWRIIKNNDPQNAQKQLTTSKSLVDLSRSLDQVYDITSLINILLKNRFAKNKYSLIPLLAFKNNNLYLILNPVKCNSNSKFIVNKNHVDITFKNQKQTLSLKHANEILRFLKAMNLNAEIIIPAPWQHQSQNILFCPLEEIGDYIRDDQKIINTHSIQKSIQKIKQLNLFDKKTTTRNIYV